MSSAPPPPPTNRDAPRHFVPPVPPVPLAPLVPSRPAEPPWWTPTAFDSLRYIGYRWIFFIPVVALLSLIPAAIFYMPIRQMVFVPGIKLFILAIGVAISLAGYAIRQATAARTEPFCIHCGYNLTGLPDHHKCPECGRAYRWSDIAEYRRDPHWFVARWKARHELPKADRPFESGTVARKGRSRDGTE